jgi:hypothetical protein
LALLSIDYPRLFLGNLLAHDGVQALGAAYSGLEGIHVQIADNDCAHVALAFFGFSNLSRDSRHKKCLVFRGHVQLAGIVDCNEQDIFAEWRSDSADRTI